MRIYLILIYIFLYAPIALIVGGSFNAGKQAMIWQGFSLEWYGKAFSNPLITEALGTSLYIALSTAAISAVLGLITALVWIPLVVSGQIQCTYPATGEVRAAGRGTMLGPLGRHLELSTHRFQAKALSDSKLVVLPGDELLKFVEEYVRSANGRVLIIETSSLPKLERTRRFYAKRGYVLCGQVPDFYADGDDKVIFAKRIAGPVPGT